MTDWAKVSIAPMMDITDRRFRYFIRLINSQVRLYTEMIVSHAIIRGDRQRLLAFDPSEHPVILQLGGDDPAIMAQAAVIGADFGYDGIDINCGCPSERVESGNFGVCLMREPERVAGMVAKIAASAKVPVSVKCRIGITGEESEAGLHKFAKMVFESGAASLTVHARTATLGGIIKRDDGAGGQMQIETSGLSPKQNRDIPPLDYETVYRLKQMFSNNQIEINGGIKSLDSIARHLENTDRVMIGRLAHEDPAFFTEAGSMTVEMRFEILNQMTEYATRYEKADLTAAKFFTGMLNIFHGVPGARLARRFLSEEGRALSPREALLKLSNSAGITGAVGFRENIIV